jgi:hypothetical protein
MPKPVTIVTPADTYDSDKWSIITNREQLIAAIRAWLGDVNPEFLHELERCELDGGRVYDGLPGSVDEIIDHIKEQQQ